MQKSRHNASPPRARKARGGSDTDQRTQQQGSNDWLMEQQRVAGNQTVLGMIGGERDTQEIAGGRPIGRMIEWSPKRGGEMKCRAIFPPGTEVTAGDVGTIADRWGYRVERWEEINGNVHVEFVTKAPEDQFAWGNEVILGQPPPETVLEQVQETEGEGKELLGAASGLLAATLLAPPSQAGLSGTASSGVASPQPGLTPPGLAPQPAAAASTGLAASLVAAALGTPAPAQATPGSTQAAPGLAPSPAVAPGVAPATPTAKAGMMEAVLGTGQAPGKAPSPDEQLQRSAQAFTRELDRSSPDLGSLERIATSVRGTRLFELLGRSLDERKIDTLVRAGQASSGGMALLGLLEGKLYPQLSSGAQAAWDAVLDEAMEEEPGKAPPSPSSGAELPELG